MLMAVPTLLVEQCYRINEYGDLYPDDVNELDGWARVVSRVSSP